MENFDMTDLSYILILQTYYDFSYQQMLVGKFILPSTSCSTQIVV